MKTRISFCTWIAALLTLALAEFSETSASNSSSVDKLKVSLYYETRCPDSIQFLVTQLYPTFLAIPDYLIIDLVPYGKAKTTVNPDGTYSFRCQHGPKECAGNKVHACAIEHISSPAKLMAYANCTLDSKTVWSRRKRCAKRLNIPFSEIELCATTEEGNELLKNYGVRTTALNPRVTWVPWVTLNNVFYREDFDQLQHDFFSVVCKHLNAPKPPSCNPSR